MSDTTAARLLSLNQQAIAILGLNIPLDFGLGSETAERLRDINERLLADAGRDLSPEALLEKHDLPERYRAIARMLLASDDPVPVFESIAIQELDRDAAATPLRQAIKEPLLVAGLAYLGMILFCTFSVPSIETQYTQQGLSPSGVTQWLIAIRGAMPYWIIGVPVLLIAGWWIWRQLANGPLLALFPGGNAYSRLLAAESQSRHLAVLIASGVEQETALSLASSGVSPRVPIRPIAESIVRSGAPQTRSRALTRLAGFYHFLAGDRRQTLFAKVPAFLGLLFAGLIVLGYGLATFLPWIAILQSGGVTEALNR
ncbi:hypothetical protein Enr13x_69050 [Stieleria neptunia]|uniref:Type II secretion system protein GspF domain-containing protein n=1 Tax=Stieleria neptunia TaxID=2527979 RepID=A0A518I1R1_9BACT|nr:hypothetical protein [Stieleria neptunia]QDV46996.1 hypothetical protein Enr13x_69050 [Stieleria neptunia]